MIDWISIPLSDLPIASGKSINPFEYPEEEFELYSVPAHETSRPEIVKGCDIGSNKQVVSPGTVLLCKINPRINRTWVVAQASQRRQIASTEWIAFVDTDSVDRRYLKYFLQQAEIRDYLAANASGVGGSLMRVKPATLKGLTFRAPGLLTQQRIVEKLDELLSDLDSGVSELKAAQHKLAQYRQSLLKAAVEGTITADWRAAHAQPQEAGADLLQRILAERRTRWEQKQLAKFAAQGKTPLKGWQAKYPEPVTPDIASLPELPRGWVWASVDQVSLVQRYGSSAKTSEDSSGVPVLRMGNIQGGELDVGELKYLPSDHTEFPDLYLEDGDLLFNRTNSPELVGKTAVYRSQVNPCSFASYLISVRLSPWCIPELVAAYINSAYGRRWVKSVVTQQVGQANVNGSKLAALAIPLAPIDEQRMIAECLLEQKVGIGTQDGCVEHGLKQSAAQRKNLLKAAFTGQLVQQDPSDEPARELLARIRAARAAVAGGATTRRGRMPRKTA